MNPPPGTPDTIVLVHGFWVTPRSWEHWITHYEARGYRVLAPGYPGFEVEVEALNEDPSPIEALTAPAIIEHFEDVLGELDSPPILIGHSAGGAFVQVLLDHGFGAAGVAMNSAPTEGVEGRAVLAAALDLPGPEEPGEPSQGRRLRLRPVQLRVHEHVRGGRGAPALRALRDPGLRPDPVGQRAREPPARPAGHPRRLPQRRPGAAAVRLRHRRPHHAAEDPAAPTPSTTSRDTVTEIREYEGPHLLPAVARAGRPSPTRSSTGRSSMPPRAPRSEAVLSASRE